MTVLADDLAAAFNPVVFADRLGFAAEPWHRAALDPPNRLRPWPDPTRGGASSRAATVQMDIGDPQKRRTP